MVSHIESQRPMPAIAGCADRRWRLSVRHTICLLAVMAFTVGCPPKPRPQKPITETLNTGTVRPIRDPTVVPVNSNDIDDLCATRLHDLEGMLLQYCLVKGTLPQKLDALRTVANVDQPVDLTCPISHELYIYDPQGLASPTIPNERLILYDSKPAHDGRRWGVLIRFPIRTGVPLVTSAIVIPESEFRRYKPVQPPP